MAAAQDKKDEWQICKLKRRQRKLRLASPSREELDCTISTWAAGWACAKKVPCWNHLNACDLFSDACISAASKKNFRRRDLANDLARTAIGGPIAVVPERHGSAAVEDCDPTEFEIKLTHVRHWRCLTVSSLCNPYFGFFGEKEKWEIGN
jgi:hypothetical protein